MEQWIQMGEEEKWRLPAGINYYLWETAPTAVFLFGNTSVAT